MSSLRLEEKIITLDGRTYTLRCNMAVLDTIQEAHGGDFAAVMKLPATAAMAEILAAMLNDYAEDMGWETDWTARKVKKNVSYAGLVDLDILGMFARAVIPARSTAAAAAPAPEGDGPETDDPGN